MSAYSDRIVADGASNYWRLNETGGITAVDSIGGNNGTGQGGVSVGLPSPLNDGTTAIAFDGGDSSKIVTTLTGVYNGASALSWELWVRLTSLTMPNGLRMAAQLGNVTTENYLAASATQGWMVSLNIGGTQKVAAIAGLDLAWHHLVATYDGANLRLYKDGVLANTLATTGALANAGAFVIGNWNIVGYGWNGALDEVAIYPRVLPPTDIAMHYSLRNASAVPVVLPRDYNTTLMGYLIGVTP